MVKLCPLAHQHRPTAFADLSQAFKVRFQQCGSIDDIYESIGRKAVPLCSERYPSHDTFPINLAYSLQCYFNHQCNV
ncbi:hypothetical protein DFJ58DRAFT_669386 [Suillus subalutaceus]|uniref:uncharacterized protein n=1 Tax=Suillus subalutaceus TaxID=48586 RepID=UPI001B860C28|nr:uncharacterized protein DFJ58DRAFT_669386 [Suillus subalutaceus]KAG1836772.1 hypothetical protein DFJ58DRAFT_669386 [Suillus subalutaceus]